MTAGVNLPQIDSWRENADCVIMNPNEDNHESVDCVSVVSVYHMLSIIVS